MTHDVDCLFMLEYVMFTNEVRGYILTVILVPVIYKVVFILKKCFLFFIEKSIVSLRSSLSRLLRWSLGFLL